MDRKGDINLDDIQVYKRLDAGNMLQHLHEFPLLCKEAYEQARDFKLPKAIMNFDKIVILGMGGSAIGGDLLHSLAIDQATVPISIYRGYKLPRYVDKGTLVIASSYSGNTEETLSCFNQSVALGAKNLVITTGGKIKSLAEKSNIPVFSYSYQSPPRAALPYSLMPLLVFMQRLKVLGDMQTDIEETFRMLQNQAIFLNEDVDEQKNKAKKYARMMYNRIPVVYGVETVGEVAHRWKTQINENSKSWAFHEIFPELNHNAVVGYEFPTDLKDQIIVVVLNSAFISPRLKLRLKATENILREANIKYEDIDGPVDNRIAEMMGLVLLGDYISYYLAILNQTAPGPAKAIDYLKSELSKYTEEENVGALDNGGNPRD